MIQLEQKYEALLQEAGQRQLPGLKSIRTCFQVLSLAGRIDRDCAAQLAPFGLSEGRFVVLFLLGASAEGLAPAVLAERAGVTRATMTGLIDSLEKDLLVERHADPVDRRALRIRLTPKGKRLAQKVFKAHGQWIAGLFGGLTEKEQDMLGHLLGKAAAGLAPHGTVGGPAQ